MQVSSSLLLKLGKPCETSTKPKHASLNLPKHR